jgi:hypothetical protein
MDLNEILKLDRRTIYKYLHVLGQEIYDSSNDMVNDMEYLQSLLLSCFPYQCEEDRKGGNFHIESEAPSFIYLFFNFLLFRCGEIIGNSCGIWCAI